MILFALCTLLLVTFLLLFKDVSDRFRLLFDDIRENAVWSVYQLDREARVLDTDLIKAQMQGLSDGQTRANIAMRYEILYSRIDLVNESQFGARYSQDPLVTGTLATIRGLIGENQSFFDRIAAGKPVSADDIKKVDTSLSALARETERLLIYTNTYVGDERATIRNSMIELEKTSTVMLTLLMLSVIFLVVNLRRQLKSVRETSHRLEILTRELSDAYEAADAGNRAKSQFMATMGHEIRTPLNAILGMAELMEYTQLPPDALQSVKTIRTSGEALLEVINEVLDYSKIEHGKLELEERAVDIAGLAESAISIVRGRADNQGNVLVLDIPTSLDALYVRTDPTRLRQVLLNLLSNAVKFTHQGTVTLRLREFYRGSALMLRFEVEDTGIGIDEAGLAKLFKPFSQVDASINRKYGGTGLGLTICKQIVEKLGGELGMSSTVDVGSIFWFELPVMRAGKDDVRQKSGGSIANDSLPRLTILLVEDNAVNQQVASRFLEKLGQNVVLAHDGQEAVEKTETAVFDLILMDMHMPHMDGIEATRHIISRGGPSALTPIVAMTANASDDDRRRCRAAGMVGFESKPVTLARLKDVILTFAPSHQEPLPSDDTSGNAHLSLSHVLPEVLDGLETDLTFSPSSEAAAFVPVLHDEPPMSLADHLYAVSGLDSARQSELIEALGDEIYQELIASFFNDADQLLADLNQAIAARDSRETDRVLHTIKGAAVNVGLNDIAARAHALRSGAPNADDVSSLFEQIETMKLKLVA
nr:ATP-binding protein [Allorhizobium sonneratiae]